jgi:hypothetical protein
MKLHIRENSKPYVGPEAVTTDKRVVVWIYPDTTRVSVGTTQYESPESLVAVIRNDENTIYVKTGEGDNDFAFCTPGLYDP